LRGADCEVFRRVGRTQTGPHTVYGANGQTQHVVGFRAAAYTACGHDECVVRRGKHLNQVRAMDHSSPRRSVLLLVTAVVLFVGWFSYLLFVALFR